MAAIGRIMLTEISRRRLFAVLNIALGAFAASAVPFLRESRADEVGRAGTDGAAGRKYVCTNSDCDPYVYDPALGDADNINGTGEPIPAGTAFADLPHDWVCPYCASGKDWFRPLTG